jgi:transposase-like protein
MAWTEDQKKQAIAMYLEGEPTPENSVELIKEIAEAIEGQTANGVRQVLVQAKVYVKKDATAPATTTKTGATGDKAPRVSKEDQIATLRAAIEAAGKTVDEDIISKLTGKAAVYFASLFK